MYVEYFKTKINQENMGLSTIIKKKFSDPKIILEERFAGAKYTFTLSSLFFFVNYFLVAAQFGTTTFFLFILPMTYISFLISIVFLTYYAIKIKFNGKVNAGILLVFLIVLLLIMIILSIGLLVPQSLIPNVI